MEGVLLRLPSQKGVKTPIAEIVKLKEYNLKYKILEQVNGILGCL